MLVTVFAEQQTDGFEVTAPDLPDLMINSGTLDQALARAHLAIEVMLGAYFAEHDSMPDVRTLAQLRDTADYPSGSLYEIYVEDLQLAAMAVHQAAKQIR